MVIELLREDGTVLKRFDYSVGAWAQKMDFETVEFSYVGDGSGQVQVRICANTEGADRLAGAMDNLTVSSK